jgi:hypothetical protein
MKKLLLLLLLATPSFSQVLENGTTIALSESSDALELPKETIASFTTVITAANPAAFTFVDGDVHVVNNTIAETAHGLTTGVKVALTNSGGALPTGTSATDYYVIVVSSSLIKLATSQANALAGTAVDITAAAGGGTHTITPNTTIAGTIKYQESNEPDTVTKVWVDTADSPVAFTATSNFLHDFINISAKRMRAVITVTSGTVTATVRANAKR